MSKFILSTAALALAAMFTVGAPAGAAERRADGVTSTEAAPAEVSSQRRWYGRRYWGGRSWGRRYGYWGRPYWRPRYAAWGPGYGYWRPRYAYAGYGYPYYYRPWRPFPVLAFGFGFGPRWWW